MIFNYSLATPASFNSAQWKQR